MRTRFAARSTSQRPEASTSFTAREMAATQWPQLMSCTSNSIMVRSFIAMTAILDLPTMGRSSGGEGPDQEGYGDEPGDRAEEPLQRNRLQSPRAEPPADHAHHGAAGERPCERPRDGVGLQGSEDD